MGNPLHHSMEAIPPGNPLLAQFVNQKNAVILSGAAQLYRAAQSNDLLFGKLARPQGW